MQLRSCCLLLCLSPTLFPTAYAADTSAIAEAGVKLTTSPYDASAKFRAVHIDTLDPHLQHVFEAARIEWLKVLATHNTTDGRGFFFQRDRSTLLTLRSFNSFTEYDALRAFRASVGTRIGPEGEKAGQQYDQGDVAITFPHNSEVWSRNEAFDYHAPGPALNEYTAGFMQMVLEHVRSDDYEAAWKEMRAALTTVKYPISRIGFFSMLGSGKQISVWLAPDRATFLGAGSPEEAVAKVLGKAKAHALLNRLKEAGSHVEISELVPRPELKSPE
ncbi:MAG: hypothetical protein P4L92_01145 [Rudaea sp.]|nr:hypothetical protein [Rudaea sp.]